MDLLLDVNIVVDLLARRQAFVQHAMDALDRCYNNGGRIWLYAGSVQTLEYVLAEELSRNESESYRIIRKRARLLLEAFAADKQWLAALPEEGMVFDSEDPEDAQLIRALDRFPLGTIKLLTRDLLLCECFPAVTITPHELLQTQIRPKSVDFIELKTQQDAIRPVLEKNIHRVLHHGQYIMGPEIKQLEERLVDNTGAKHCITVASGTEALLISLMALGIGPGDEVITTPFTFVATAEVIVFLGATPVFVDVEPDTCNIDASKIEAVISEKTKAIIPVSLYGQPADMDEINTIAAMHGLSVIEDACQSFGATYKGKKSCNLSTIGCTSFFPSKPLGCYGDGGAIFTSDDALAQACREIRVHGQSKRYVHTRIGVGGRFDTIQAAVLLAKLKQFEWEIDQRIKIGEQYNQLMDQYAIQRVQQKSDRTSVFAQYTVLVDNRDEVQKRLTEGVSPSPISLHSSPVSVPTAVHYPVPLNEQPAYQQLCRGLDAPVAAALAKRVMSLPMHGYMGEHQQSFVASAIQEALCAK